MSTIIERHGFHFIPTSRVTEHGAEPALSLVVKMKGRSSVEFPRLSVWEYSEDEYVDFINQRGIEDATVILDDFSFLKRCPGLKMLTLFPSYEAPKGISYEPVYQMPNLRMIEPNTVYGYADRKWTELDCAKLASAGRLEVFQANCRKGVKGLGALRNLRSLSVSNFPESDLSQAIGSASLDSLSVLKGKLKSLKGLEHTQKLKALRLSDCYQLENIDTLYDAHRTLTGLVIDNCKRIQDYSVLASLSSLTRLSLIGTGSIPSLSFLPQLPNLRTLTLGVNVEDGDLSYCDGLQHVSFYPNRRHYNRKDEDFPKMKRPEMILGDERIEPWRQTILR